MDLMDLLNAAGGGDSVGQLGKTVGLGSSDTSSLVKALAPALMRGIQKNTADDDGLTGLRRAMILKVGDIGFKQFLFGPFLHADAGYQAGMFYRRMPGDGEQASANRQCVFEIVGYAVERTGGEGNRIETTFLVDVRQRFDDLEFDIADTLVVEVLPAQFNCFGVEIDTGDAVGEL